MRVNTGTIERARLGRPDDFAAIVRAYKGSLFALAAASTGSREDAEDAVQDIFINILCGLRNLRKVERFESWLFAVARNLLASRARARAAAPHRAEVDPDELGGVSPGHDAGDEGSGAEPGLLPFLTTGLSAEQTLAMALRYGAGLTVRETALACGLPESVAKSRLGEARMRMRAASRASMPARPMRRTKMRAVFGIPSGMEERIMENIETVRLAASVLERLAIYDQVRLATLCRKGEKFDEELLTAMGKITGGSELVRRVGARLAIGELALALNYADGGTGSRVLEELERVDPATLKQVRGGMLFIEDLLLLEDAHIRRVLEETEEEELACALKGVEAAVQDAVYRNLPGPAVAKLRERMELMGPVPFGKVMESHWAIVATMRRLAETGEIVMPGRGQART